MLGVIYIIFRGWRDGDKLIQCQYLGDFTDLDEAKLEARRLSHETITPPPARFSQGVNSIKFEGVAHDDDGHIYVVALQSDPDLTPQVLLRRFKQANF